MPMTQDQWMAIAGALQNLGGAFTQGQQGRGNPMMLQAVEQQRSATKKKEWQDMLAKMLQPGGQQPPGTQYASAATNLLPPAMGGQGPVGQPPMPSQVPQQQAQAPGSQFGLTPELVQMLGGMDEKAGRTALFNLMNKKPTQPQIKADQNSIPRYVKTGKRVFPEVEADPDAGPIEFSSSGSYVTPDGQQVQGYFNKRAGRYLYRDANDVEQPLPSGSKKVTPSSQLFREMRPGEQLKLAVEMGDLEKGTRDLYKYLDRINQGSQGLELVADRWLAHLKTVFSPWLGADGKLSKTQYAALMQSGKIQGLLGQFRREVVGGGVMTEPDALRVLSALGGDFSATRNNEVVRGQLRDILEERLVRYNDVYLPFYNEQGRLKRPKTWKDKPRLELQEKYFGGYPDRADRKADEDLANRLKNYD